jgi:protein-S-isoprenylcysteine O-methyltransferase Ste14
MRSLELKIPPLLLAAGIALAMWLLSSLVPAVPVSSNVSLALATVVGLLGIAFSAAGSLAFQRNKTTVNPLHPENASSLVTTGVYRVSRNPMYVGMMLGLLAWAIGLSSPVALAGPVAFIMYINRFQIEPEERALAAKFGKDFAAYRASVRRWL